MQKLAITEARNRFMQLPELASGEQVLAITRRNKEVMALMSWELYEGLLETLEVLADRELMNNLKQGLDDVRNGRTLTLEEALKRLEP